MKPVQRNGLGAIGVIFPFFTGGRLEATGEEARAELESALASRDELQHQIRLEVTQAYYQLLDLAQRIQITDQQQRVAQEVLSLAQARFRAQLSSFLDVLTTEVALTRAQTDHARALFDYERAKAELNFATARAARS